MKAVFGIGDFVNFYIRKGMPYLEELQKRYKVAVFIWKLGATYYTVINDFEATSVTYDPQILSLSVPLFRYAHLLFVKF